MYQILTIFKLLLKRSPVGYITACSKNASLQATV